MKEVDGRLGLRLLPVLSDGKTYWTGVECSKQPPDASGRVRGGNFIAKDAAGGICVAEDEEGRRMWSRI